MTACRVVFILLQLQTKLAHFMPGHLVFDESLNLVQSGFKLRFLHALNETWNSHAVPSPGHPSAVDEAWY